MSFALITSVSVYMFRAQFSSELTPHLSGPSNWILHLYICCTSRVIPGCKNQSCTLQFPSIYLPSCCIIAASRAFERGPGDLSLNIFLGRSLTKFNAGLRVRS